MLIKVFTKTISQKMTFIHLTAKTGVPSRGLLGVAMATAEEAAPSVRPWGNRHMNFPCIFNLQLRLSLVLIISCSLELKDIYLSFIC